MNVKSIQTKIALAAGICLLITAGSLVGFSVYTAHTSQQLVSQKVTDLVQETTLEQLEMTAIKNAEVIRRRLEVGLNTARTMADSVSGIKTIDSKSNHETLTRKTFNGMLLNVLKMNPTLNGTYSCWMPNAFDNNDQNYTSGTDGNTAITGRFTPYWTRDDNGSIDVQPLVEFDSNEKHPNGVVKGNWFLTPKRTLKETMTAPLPYTVQGKRVWLATMSSPVVVDGKFLGVVGTDFNLDFIQQLSTEVANGIYSGRSHVTIVTDSGLVIADNQKPEYIGQSLSNIYGDLSNKVIELINDKKTYMSNDKKNNTIKVLAPISIGNTGITWAITIEVDRNLALANVHALDKDLEETNSNNMLMQLLIGAVIAVLAIIAIILVAKRLTIPILKSVQMAKTIAQGQFDNRLNYHASDEVGQLASALDGMAESLQKQVNVAEYIAAGDLSQDVVLASERDQLGLALAKMVTDLNELVSQIKQRSEVIGSNADSVAGLSQDLASGATESASSVTEISATVTQIAAQMRQSSENAGKANELSKNNMQSAEKGSALMHELQEAMRDIESSSNDINDIISSIEAIAEQTNLLALNAAIEAARAGEYGRGFAVVADEVRNLAARSAEAVQQTAKLVEASAQKTQRGIVLSQDTAGSLSTIVNNITEVSLLMDEIAQASNEQALGAEQVAEGINQIDEVTHQNSENSESCAAAAAELTDQSNSLSKLIQQFKLKR